MSRGRTRGGPMDAQGLTSHHAKEHHKKALNSINRTRNVDVFAPEITDIANTVKRDDFTKLPRLFETKEIGSD